MLFISSPVLCLAFPDWVKLNTEVSILSLPNESKKTGTGSQMKEDAWRGYFYGLLLLL